MENDRVFTVSQSSCNHTKERQYTQRNFDMLNGFEFVFTRCMNCHKILIIDEKKLGNQ